MWIEIYILDFVRLLFLPWFFLWNAPGLFFEPYFLPLLLNFFDIVIEANILNLRFFFLLSFLYGRRNGFLLWLGLRLFSSLFNFLDIIVETNILNLRFLNCFLFFLRFFCFLLYSSWKWFGNWFLCCRRNTISGSVIWHLPIHKLGFMPSCAHAHAFSKIFLLGCSQFICTLFRNSLRRLKILLGHLLWRARLRSTLKGPSRPTIP